MALKPLTLQERVKQAQALAQQSTNKLAAEKGLVAPPITAAGVGALQGTPQQQAMAGTPAQKKGALSAAVQGQVAQPTGETGLELAQKMRAPAPEEEATRLKMQKFSQALGTYGDKVSEWINGAINTATSTTAEGRVQVKLELAPEKQKEIDSKKTTLTKDQVSKLDTAIAALQTPGQTLAAINTAIQNLNDVLGNDTVAELLTGTAMEQFWRPAKEAGEVVAGQLQTGVQKTLRGADDKLTLEDITTLGSSIDEIAGLLNIPKEQVTNLSLREFQAKLEAVGQAEMGQTQQVQAGMARLSRTEREALRTLGQQLEEAGIAGAEFQFDQLLSDIEAGRTVELGGKSYTVEDILNTDVIADIAKQYYAGTNKELIDVLKKESPSLVKFLDDNKAAIVATIEASAAGAERLVEHNKKEQSKKKEITPDIMGFYNLGQNYNPDSVSGLGVTADFSEATVGRALASLVAMPDGPAKEQAFNNFRELIRLVPVTAVKDDKGVVTIKAQDPALQGLVDAIKNASLSDIQSGTLAQNLQTALNNYSILIDPNRSDQDLINALFSDDPSIEDINTQLKKDYFSSTWGGPTSSYWELDANKDGTLSREEILALAKNRATISGDLKNVKSGGESLKSAQPTTLTPEQQTMFNIAADGVYDDAEFANIDLDTMANIFNAFARPEEDRAAKSPLLAAIRRNYLRKLDETKVSGYQARGLGPNGVAVGAPQSVSRPFNPNDRTTQTYKSAIENSINNIKALMSDTANPDLRWRYEQDYNRLMGELAVINDDFNKAGWGKAAETKEGAIASQTKKEYDTAVKKVENFNLASEISTASSTLGQKNPAKRWGI